VRGRDSVHTQGHFQQCLSPCTTDAPLPDAYPFCDFGNEGGESADVEVAVLGLQGSLAASPFWYFARNRELRPLGVVSEHTFLAGPISRLV
jgi:hypothetical protein